MIVSIRTDKPEAEIGLFDAKGAKLEYVVWHAHRELSATLLPKLRDVLARHDGDFADIRGVVVYEGPGSFTGLRIGITVANTLAYGLDRQIVGSRGEDWCQKGIEKLLAGDNHRLVLPYYGAEAHITQQKK